MSGDDKEAGQSSGHSRPRQEQLSGDTIGSGFQRSPKSPSLHVPSDPISDFVMVPSARSSDLENAPGEMHSDHGSDFENVTFEEAFSNCTLDKLMETFSVEQYCGQQHADPILYKCESLFQKDYKLQVVKNERLTENYPKMLLIPIARQVSESEMAMNFDAVEYSKLVHEYHFVRIRSRVVVPVILFDNKFICRSGTLTVWLSALYEKLLSFTRTEERKASFGAFVLGAFSFLYTKVSEMVTSPGSIYSEVRNILGMATSPGSILSEMRNILDMARNSLGNIASLSDAQRMDAKVMEHLNVENLCDLMVEYKKNYKGQLNVSSTEVNGDAYKNIKMQEMPFPGCEFFVYYKEAGRNPDGLVFDWSQRDVERSLVLTQDLVKFIPELNTQMWRVWDLVTLTSNYLKIMLSCLVRSTGSMNLHCISGWDRTPLFVSLLRLSLWADGLIHESLNTEEMAYFTVAYDWYLFGHHLPDRLKKGEEIMHFAFNFLKRITSDEFSATRMFEELSENEKRGRAFPKFESGRRSILSDVGDLVLKEYTAHIAS